MTHVEYFFSTCASSSIAFFATSSSWSLSKAKKIGCSGECWLMASVDSVTYGSLEIGSEEIAGVGGGDGTTVEVGAVPVSPLDAGCVVVVVVGGGVGRAGGG